MVLGRLSFDILSSRQWKKPQFDFIEWSEWFFLLKITIHENKIHMQFEVFDIVIVK